MSRRLGAKGRRAELIRFSNSPIMGQELFAGAHRKPAAPVDNRWAMQISHAIMPIKRIENAAA